MKKIEIIWREILEESKTTAAFEQKKLAQKYGFSTSTVFAALLPLRNIGAVTVTGRNFRVGNFEKILLFWATHRNLQKDIAYRTHVDLPILEIEGMVDNQTVFAAYSGARMLLGLSPSDYDKVYVYHPQPDNLMERFPKSDNKNPNFFVINPDQYLGKFGKTTPPSQTFVDLWNLSDWYADEFIKVFKEKYYAGLLQ